MDVVLLESGGSNIQSVKAAFARLGVEACMTADPERIRRATHVVLPGVGAAAAAMATLKSNGLIDLIPTLTQPLLGVCVGMQLLFEHSEEGDTRCLGLLPGVVRRFDRVAGLRIPHMGWNQLTIAAPHPLLAGISMGSYAYFVHSYHAAPGPSTLATCDYGGAFAAVVGAGNIFGAQLHPERSALVGSRLLQNFLSIRT
ncbi:imidazole glycerol phosphate synthase subunit HisH [Ahniella affigens]|uniref:Imidazole glycerol phosphate synthase subunit HisH n=1 Tax=Ahniella affigens TaxID=2021234 RepID=A0A2P1PYU1_9GAMM|nr:imidazole glycerol phosphate synthase subunit HisH [Ahniella affigens]AVQ00023.1 imidazole glycerol phosphate synthase subunit HisH [Ahniella affigens]